MGLKPQSLVETEKFLQTPVDLAGGWGGFFPHTKVPSFLTSWGGGGNEADKLSGFYMKQSEKGRFGEENWQNGWQSISPVGKIRAQARQRIEHGFGNRCQTSGVKAVGIGGVGGRILDPTASRCRGKAALLQHRPLPKLLGSPQG